MRIEPPPSLPWPTGMAPAATSAAVPSLELAEQDALVRTLDDPGQRAVTLEQWPVSAVVSALRRQSSGYSTRPPIRATSHHSTRP